MINLIFGQAVHIEGSNLLVMTNSGVGYGIFATKTLVNKCASQSNLQNILIFISTVFKQDEIKLYGFANKAEMDAFTLLTSVQGIGSKMAIAIISHLDSEQLYQAISSEDLKTLTIAEGVGLKIAKRIINELKDKAFKLSLTNDAFEQNLYDRVQFCVTNSLVDAKTDVDNTLSTQEQEKLNTLQRSHTHLNNSNIAANKSTNDKQILNDVVSALKNLGYNENYARQIVIKIISDQQKLASY